MSKKLVLSPLFLLLLFMVISGFTKAFSMGAAGIFKSVTVNLAFINIIYFLFLGVRKLYISKVSKMNSFVKGLYKLISGVFLVIFISSYIFWLFS